MTLRIKWVALAMQQNHGYGRVGRKLMEALAELPEVSLVDRLSTDWDLRVVVGTPDSWFLDHFHPDLVLHTMWEARPLPSSWPAVVNNAGAVWVPSRFCHDILREGGITQPIIVSGYGVDPREYAFVERDRDPDEPYTFLTWARTLIDRKNTLDVIRAFLRADLPNARLIVKHNFNLGPPSHDGEWAEIFPKVDVHEFRGKYREQPVEGVTVLTGDLSTWELAMLMARCDAFVYLSGGEGFGLMPLEAMATGLPVIAPVWSGLAEFISDEVALPVPVVGFGDGGTLNRVWGEACQVARMDLDAVAERMTWCYGHRAEAAELGQRAAEYVAQEWTWDVAARRALELLQARAADARLEGRSI